MSETIAVFIPIVMTIVTGLVIVTYYYFKSKEKQMMIEKGMSYEQMMEFMNSRKKPYTLLKVGIIIIFFGLGMGIGIAFADTAYEFLIPLSIFVLTGLGFVTAFYFAKRLEDSDAEKNQ